MIRFVVLVTSRHIQVEYEFQGFAIPADKQATKVPVVYDNQEYVLSHGSVVIAAITSCTNTSNPSVMLGAGKNR